MNSLVSVKFEKRHDSAAHTMQECCAADEDESAGFMEKPSVTDRSKWRGSCLARAAVVTTAALVATAVPIVATAVPSPSVAAKFDVANGQCSSAETECIMDLRVENVTISTTSDRFFHRSSRNIAQQDHRFVCQVAPFHIAEDHWITSFEPLIMPHAPTNDASFMHHTNVYLCTEDVLEWARMAETDPDACFAYTFSKACPRLAWAYDKTGGAFRTHRGSGMQLGQRIWLSRILLVAHYLAPIEQMPVGWAITDHSGVRMTLTRQPQVPSAIFGMGSERRLVVEHDQTQRCQPRYHLSDAAR